MQRRRWVNSRTLGRDVQHPHPHPTPVHSRPQPRHTPQKQTFQRLVLPALTLLALAALTAALTALLLPSAAPPSLDAAHEVHTLHHDPSPHFCALSRRPLVCAHGGDAEAHPANTLPAFAAALAAGADCVEVDVSMTRDGHLVALHDRELAELLRRQGGSDAGDGIYAPGARFARALGVSRRRKKMPRTGDYTWHQLSSLRWGPAGPGVAAFSDVLDAVLRPKNASRDSINHNIAITVDVKLPGGGDEGGEAAAMAAAVVAALRSARCGRRCLVWAKADAVAAAVKALDTSHRVGLVVVNGTAAARAAGLDRPLRAASLGAEVAGVHYAMASASLASQLRRAGREMHVWTADAAGMMAAALDAGPDAVVTGRPRRLLEALSARAEACRRRRRRAN